MRPFAIARLSMAVLVAAMLGACAGGGGGGGGGVVVPVTPPSPPPPPPSPPPPPPPPGAIPDATSPEYLRNWAIANTKAVTAWRNGATGQGVVVAVIDDGVQSDHPEIDSGILPASRDINAGRNQLFTPTQTHGSELSALIAGEFNGDSTIGMAYNAAILAVRADNSAGGFGAQDLANAIDYAIAQGVQIINFSLGSASPSSPTFQNAIQRATAAGIIIVVSAGNDGPFATEVNYPGFLSTNLSVSNGLIVVAGAHDRSNAQINFSNRAGQSQNWYITAPGNEIIVPDFSNPGPTNINFQVCGIDAGLEVGLCRVQGTSYSAPIVTGAVALLRGAFPGLAPSQVVDLLLRSADDAGDPGIDPVTGRGRLNVEKAFQPVGTLAAALVPGAPETAVTSPIGVIGAPFGDGVTGDPGHWNSVAFDAYGRTFSVNLARNWVRPQPTAMNSVAPLLWNTATGDGASLSFAVNPDVEQSQFLRKPWQQEPQAIAAMRMQTYLSPRTRVAFAADMPALPSATTIDARGHMAFAGAERAVAVSHNVGQGLSLGFSAQTSRADLGLTLGERDRRAFAARLDAERGPLSLSAHLGVLREEGAALGLSWSNRVAGAPGDGASRFVGVSGAYRVRDTLTLAASIEGGETRFDAASLFTLTSPARTSAFALGARLDGAPLWLSRVAPGATGAVTASISQPLRIESGSARVTLPTANEWGRQSLSYETRRFDIAPSGREVQVELGWTMFVGEDVALSANLSQTQDPGHRADAKDETRVGIGLRWRP